MVFAASRATRGLAGVAALGLLCVAARATARGDAAPGTAVVSGGAASTPGLPLAFVRDVPLPGRSTRFDYQALDADHGHLVLAHMGDGAVLVLDAADGSVAKVVANVPGARGVAVGGGRIFVTSLPASLVIIDAQTLAEIARVRTGRGPDGVAYDPVRRVVAVSDQRDGAVSLLAAAGDGARTVVPLGRETGNVVFDPTRRSFWAAVARATPADELVEIDPDGEGRVVARISLPGCAGAHGVRLQPGGHAAFVACEDNDTLARVDLDSGRIGATAPTGAGPDVLDVDPGLGWLYVASESGELVVFDVSRPGLVAIDREHPGDGAHSVAVDPRTHRVFFPLAAGRDGRPVLRVMQPRAPAGARP